MLIWRLQPTNAMETHTTHNTTQSIAMPKHIFGAHANICRIRIFVYILVQILQITRQRSLATPQIRAQTHTHTDTVAHPQP